MLSRPNGLSSPTNRGVCAVAYWSLTENLTQSLRVLSNRERVAEMQSVPIHAPARRAGPLVSRPSAYGIIFRVGGDSLSAAKMARREQCFGKTLSRFPPFEAPTIEGVAAALRRTFGR